MNGNPLSGDQSMNAGSSTKREKVLNNPVSDFQVRAGVLNRPTNINLPPIVPQRAIADHMLHRQTHVRSGREIGVSHAIAPRRQVENEETKKRKPENSIFSTNNTSSMKYTKILPKDVYHQDATPKENFSSRRSEDTTASVSERNAALSTLKAETAALRQLLEQAQGKQKLLTKGHVDQTQQSENKGVPSQEEQPPVLAANNALEQLKQETDALRRRLQEAESNDRRNPNDKGPLPTSIQTSTVADSSYTVADKLVSDQQQLLLPALADADALERRHIVSEIEATVHRLSIQERELEMMRTILLQSGQAHPRRGVPNSIQAFRQNAAAASVPVKKRRPGRPIGSSTRVRNINQDLLSLGLTPDDISHNSVEVLEGPPKKAFAHVDCWVDPAKDHPKKIQKNAAFMMPCSRQPNTTMGVPLISFRRQWDKIKASTKDDKRMLLEMFLRDARSGRVPIVSDSSITGRYSVNSQSEVLNRMENQGYITRRSSQNATKSASSVKQKETASIDATSNHAVTRSSRTNHQNDRTNHQNNRTNHQNDRMPSDRSSITGNKIEYLTATPNLAMIPLEPRLSHPRMA